MIANNDVAATRYLAKLRWRDGEFCPYCSSARLYHRQNGIQFQCRVCNRSFSIRVGTIFQKSPMPLWKWIGIVQALTDPERLCTSPQLAQEFRVTQETAWSVLRRLRFAAHTASFRRPLHGHSGSLDESDLPNVDPRPSRRVYRVGYYRRWRLNLPWQEAIERFLMVTPQELAEAVAAHLSQLRRHNSKRSIFGAHARSR